MQERRFVLRAQEVHAGCDTLSESHTDHVVPPDALALAETAFRNGETQDQGMRNGVIDVIGDRRIVLEPEWLDEDPDIPDITQPEHHHRDGDEPRRLRRSL